MLQSKDIKSVEELKKYFSCPQKMVDHLVDLLSFFEFKGITQQLNPIKKMGYTMSSIFSVLMLLPFLKHASVYALLKSGNKELAEGCKEANGI